MHPFLSGVATACNFPTTTMLKGAKRRERWGGGSLTAPVAIISILLIIHWGLRFGTDNRPRLSWRAAAVPRHGMWRRPQNSCSGLPTPESSVGQTDTACPAPPPLNCAAAPTAGALIGCVSRSVSWRASEDQASDPRPRRTAGWRGRFWSELWTDQPSEPFWSKKTKICIVWGENSRNHSWGLVVVISVSAWMLFYGHFDRGGTFTCWQKLK